MKLNHINLVVNDVKKAIQLFERYFDFTCIEIKGDHIIAILSGADGFTLVLMGGKEEQVIYPENFHIGFILDNADQVKEKHLALKTGGIVLGAEPGKIRGSFGFYFHFDNLMIEVAHS